MSKPQEKTYTVTFKINGEVYKKRGTDLKELLLKVKPEEFLTESYITITSGRGKEKESFERNLNLVQTKRFFRDEYTLDVFLTNVYF